MCARQVHKSEQSRESGHAQKVSMAAERGIEALVFGSWRVTVCTELALFAHGSSKCRQAWQPRARS
eukprot:3255939-Rhodomonas_salina.3